MRKSKQRKKDNRVKLSGKCPYCKRKESVMLINYCYSNGEIYEKDVPYCFRCHTDDIKIRKVNNRRYKIIGELY